MTEHLLVGGRAVSVPTLACSRSAPPKPIHSQRAHGNGDAPGRLVAIPDVEPGTATGRQRRDWPRQTAVVPRVFSHAKSGVGGCVSLSDPAASASKSAIRAAAADFASQYADASSEQSERQTFWNDLFGLFGLKRRQVATFERLARRASTGNHGWVDLLFPGQMAVEHKSLGEDLDKALGQLVDYLPALTPAEYPWLLVACDFQTFRWENLEDGTSGEFALADLADNLDIFYWMAGYERPHRQFENEEAANLEATALLAVLHDRLVESGYPPHELREWLTRILFFLFADDTGVWDRAAFHAYIADQTAVDGSDLGSQVAYLFQIVNTPPESRPTNLSDELRDFTYINGDLFAETLPIATCDEEVREALLEACSFDWAAISPAIFGSMFQNVMTPAERRQLGAHYTTEANILRTIRPLFLNELWADLEAADTKPALERLLDRLARLTFFDPACGCGNFLVIAYREIRRLETEALRRLREKQQRTGQLEVDITLRCQVRVDHFYGIEIEEFPAKIARTAMYLIDHLENRRVSTEFGQHFVRFPIPASPHIIHADALELDWNEVLAAADCGYCFGNPPFAGHRYRSDEQTRQMRTLWGADYTKALDYVTCWYRRAATYASEANTEFAFVSTNSIAQGEQVDPLWKPLVAAGFGIDFAHGTFAWTSDATGRAHVHVVIVGFSRNPRDAKRLYTYPDIKGEPVEAVVKSISPYLTEGPLLSVTKSSRPISASMPPVKYGSLPNDGGGLVIQPEDLPAHDPVAMAYVRPYLGSRELLNGLERYVLWMPDGPAPGDVAKSPFLRERLARVREARLESPNPDAQAIANTPYAFFHDGQPAVPYIGIPAQSSASRLWYPVAHLAPDVIASNTLYTADDPDGFLFGILSSSMMLSWLRGIGGKIKSDYRYAAKIVHNTFPLPDPIDTSRRQAVIDAGREVLEARPTGVSLADLYEPLGMPPDLVKAHEGLDAAVNGVIAPRKRVLSTHEDRLAVLLDLYTRATGAD